MHLLGSPPIVHIRDLIPSCHTLNFFVILQTKQLILKYNISALKKLNVEFLRDFVQKEDMQNLL